MSKTPEQMLAELGKPFPREALKQRTGGGGKGFTYVETHTVVHRLNSATNGEWSFHIKSTEWRADLLIVVGELTIPGLGTRSGFGVQKVAERAGEDLLKGAASDALKKSATLFGVAADLYGPDYEAGELGPIHAQRGEIRQVVNTPRPQAATRPQGAPKSAPATLASTINEHDRQSANKRVHALLDHTTVSAAVRVKFGLESTADATAEQLHTIADLEEGKADRDAVQRWHAWKKQRADAQAAQAELMPGEDVLPNPDPARFTR